MRCQKSNAGDYFIHTFCITISDSSSVSLLSGKGINAQLTYYLNVSYQVQGTAAHIVLHTAIAEVLPEGTAVVLNPLFWIPDDSGALRLMALLPSGGPWPF